MNLMITYWRVWYVLGTQKMRARSIFPVNIILDDKSTLR